MARAHPGINPLWKLGLHPPDEGSPDRISDMARHASTIGLQAMQRACSTLPNEIEAACAITAAVALVKSSVDDALRNADPDVKAVLMPLMDILLAEDEAGAQAVLDAAMAASG